MRHCKECGIEKDESEFYLYNKGDKQYVFSYCRVCAKVKSNARYRKLANVYNMHREVSNEL